MEMELEQCFNQGQFCPQGSFSKCLKTFLVVVVGVEARDAVKWPTIHKTAAHPPTTKNYSKMSTALRDRNMGSEIWQLHRTHSYPSLLCDRAHPQGSLLLCDSPDPTSCAPHLCPHKTLPSNTCCLSLFEIQNATDGAASATNTHFSEFCKLGSSKSKCQQIWCLVRASSLVHRWPPSHCVLTWRRGQVNPLGSLITS